jgi:hypothetical protein
MIHANRIHHTLGVTRPGTPTPRLTLARLLALPLWLFALPSRSEIETDVCERLGLCRDCYMEHWRCRCSGGDA